LWFVCEADADQETPVMLPPQAEAPAADADPSLPERDARILDFEREWWKYAGAKEQAIKERFDVSPTRYYQLLNRIIDDEAAVAHDPMLVKRLRRLRSQRQRQRAARRLGADAR
jgi:hypothetical protein